MEKSVNLDDKKRYEIVAEELERFNNLVKDHRKLLRAIGDL